MFGLVAPPHPNLVPTGEKGRLSRGGAACVPSPRWGEGQGEGARRSCTFSVTLAFVIVALASPAALAAETQSPLNLCWAPDQLAAKPEERAPRKLDGVPDTKPVEHALADFAPIPQALSGSIRRVKLRGDKKLIALTFDLCEEKGAVTGYDGAIIDILRANGVKATFFAGGKWLLDHKERAEQMMSDPNFEIGNHSWDHANLKKLDATRDKAEIDEAQKAYESVREDLAKQQCLKPAPTALNNVLKRIELFRFPYGACNPEALQIAANEGVYAIQWDVAMADPVLGQTGDRIIKEVMAKVKPGSIIIGHANGRGVHTSEGLPGLIKALLDQGYQFATVSDLLKAGDPEIVQECYDRRPGDVDAYDKPKNSAPAAVPAVPNNG
jgi:peptidoglycan-N-acetylglucosamine deacetylase